MIGGYLKSTITIGVDRTLQVRVPPIIKIDKIRIIIKERGISKKDLVPQWHLGLL